MYIGIDLGGTNIAVGIVDNKGNILAHASTPTLRERHWTEIVEDMAVLTNKVTCRYKSRWHRHPRQYQQRKRSCSIYK